MLSMHFLMFIRLQGCGIISSFQVQEQRLSEGAGLALVKKLRTDKTRDQTPLLDSRPRLLVILLCCSDTVAANLHMAVWVSEHKLALCCRASPVGTYAHHWNQPWPLLPEVAPDDQEEGEYSEIGRLAQGPQLRSDLQCDLKLKLGLL